MLGWLGKILQVAGLLTVLSALFWGLSGGGMTQELLLLAVGAGVFYAGHGMGRRRS
jgi:hypothetical protein